MESAEILFDTFTVCSLHFHRSTDKRHPKISWVFPVDCASDCHGGDETHHRTESQDSLQRSDGGGGSCRPANTVLM